MRAAYDAAARRFTGLLDELCDELPVLRQAGRSGAMRAAGHGRAPHACRGGAVCRRSFHHADGGGRRRAWRRKFSARWLAAAPLDARLCQQWRRHRAASCRRRSSFTVGLMDRPDAAWLDADARSIDSRRSHRAGIATSGRHGRSFSLGIADAVTVLARTASQADAAATIIANAVDLPGHPGHRPLPGARTAARQRSRRAAGHARCRRIVGSRNRGRARGRRGLRAPIAGERA